MSDIEIAFDRVYLAGCREDARKAKIKIPKLTTNKETGFTNPFFTVWGPRGLLWQGNANSRYHAKAKCIEEILDKEQDSEE